MASPQKKNNPPHTQKQPIIRTIQQWSFSRSLWCVCVFEYLLGSSYAPAGTERPEGLLGVTLRIRSCSVSENSHGTVTGPRRAQVVVSFVHQKPDPQGTRTRGVRLPEVRRLPAVPGLDTSWGCGQDTGHSTARGPGIARILALCFRPLSPLRRQEGRT